MTLRVIFVLCAFGKIVESAFDARGLQTNTRFIDTNGYANCWIFPDRSTVYQIRNGKLLHFDPRSSISPTTESRESSDELLISDCDTLATFNRVFWGGDRRKSGSDKQDHIRHVANTRIFFDINKQTMHWMEGTVLVAFNVRQSVRTEHELSALDSTAQIVARIGSLVLLEQVKGDVVALMGALDGKIFYLSACRECTWAVDSSLRNVFVLSAEFVMQSSLDLDQLLMGRQQSAQSSFHETQKRADTPLQAPADRSTPILFVVLFVGGVTISSVLIIALCVEKTKSTNTKKTKKSKNGKGSKSDSPDKTRADTDSHGVTSIDFSASPSRADLISDRDGVTSEYSPRSPHSPRQVYFPIDASSSQPATVFSAMPQTVYSHFLPPSARSRMMVPFEDITYVTEIGSGNFGKVYLAKWQSLKVAVKVTVDENAGKFQKELSLMLHLTPHPNVVQILGFSNDGFHPLIMMEYCRGGSLSERIKDPDVVFPISRVIRILFGVARGMLHLHNANIVHRDLAARNVLLTKEGEPKLSDFGFSRLLKNAQGRSRTLLGPLCWMSPEALQTGTYSPKLDVWSFGCLIYELLARKEPHEGEDLLAIGPKIRDENLTPFTDNLRCESEELIALMRQCWTIDPVGRPDFKTICTVLEKELGIYDPDTIVLV